MIDDKDHLQRRCPRMGGDVTFHYCRTDAEIDRPCGKIFDCWWERFDVVSYLRENLSEDVFNRLADCRPKPKIVSIVELIEQTRKNLETGESD
jgi:hypothetical protein